MTDILVDQSIKMQSEQGSQRPFQRARQVFEAFRHFPIDRIIELGREAVSGEFNSDEMNSFELRLRGLDLEEAGRVNPFTLLLNMPVSQTTQPEPNPGMRGFQNMMDMAAILGLIRDDQRAQVEETALRTRELVVTAIGIMTVEDERDDASSVASDDDMKEVKKLSYCSYKDCVVAKSNDEEFLLSRSLVDKYKVDPTDEDSVQITDIADETSQPYQIGIRNILVPSTDVVCIVCMDYKPHYVCAGCVASYCDRCYHELYKFKAGNKCANCRNELEIKPYED